MKIIFLYSFSFLFSISASRAQKIAYTTESIKGKVGCNIIGKIHGEYFIQIAYFNPVSPFESIYALRGYNAPTIQKSYIYIYDKQMQLVSKEELPLPKECFGFHFITYEDFIYIFYQYTQDNHVYCMAAKIDSNGKINAKPVVLSEITLYYYTNSSIYNLTYSDDKKKIAIYTVQETKNGHELFLLILDPSLKIIEHKIFEIPVRSVFETFSDFSIDNEGNFFFLKKESFNDSDSNKNVLHIIRNNSDTLSFHNIKPNGIKLNGVSFKINNADKKLNLFSFYADFPLKELWNNIPLSKATGKAGVYNAIWDIKNKSLTETITPFTKILNSNSTDPGLMKLPIQDFFVGDIYYTQKGNFVLQGQNLDLNNPYNNIYPTQRPVDSYNAFRKRTQTYLGDNLLLLSFDSTGAFTKVNFASEYKARAIIPMNTGDALHYFFIRKERNNYIVTHLSFTNKRGIQTEIPLNIDENYKFALGYGQLSENLGYKQVSETELILPVLYRGNLNFAKIEF